MKYLTLLLPLLILSCQSKSPEEQKVSSEEQRRDKMTGAWRMTDYLSITTNGDSITDNRTQYKMYVDGSVMWGFEAAPDSTEWFGYGTYFVEGDSLFETMISGSWAFREAIRGQNNFFRIGIDVNGDTYTQVIKDDASTVYETYARVIN